MSSSTDYCCSSRITEDDIIDERLPDYYTSTTDLLDDEETLATVAHPDDLSVLSDAPDVDSFDNDSESDAKDAKDPPIDIGRDVRGRLPMNPL